MKFIWINIGMFLLTNGFSFWPVKGLYCDQIKNIDQARIYKKERSNTHRFKWDHEDISHEDLNSKVLIYLYDKNTCNSLSTIMQIDAEYIFRNTLSLEEKKLYDKLNPVDVTGEEIAEIVTMNYDIKDIREAILRKKWNKFYTDPHNRTIINENTPIIRKKALAEVHEAIDHATRFLECRFKYNMDFWKDKDLNHPDIETGLGIKYKYMRLLTQEDKKVELSMDSKGHITNESKYYDNQYINLKKSFSSCSGVKVENNEQGVLLSKNGKEIYLTTELLRRYFKKHSSQTDLARAVFNSKISKLEESKERDKLFIKYLEPEIIRLNSKILEPSDFTRLKNSRILALWCFVPEMVEHKNEDGSIKKVKEDRQMMGLAKDLKTGKLFHWTTDLGQDISVLM